ncbi:ABC transporter substrate-binding protein [Fusibacter ferrireducens]|uniref:ABC transporter substrate-binding protein n=1 Tax=Fusibacter ferrireducens TaxID=2785058 RepID=A0ABR9ZPC9_9FIRM|nr:ABC transporter substrate-binding protein [Fusibacter ferrireducens]MBF4692333.1 ABC transporter substrate-binding protein [Fusibacter ferrireducens]
MKKTKFKRILTLMLVIALVFSLAGCGGDQGADSDQKGSNTKTNEQGEAKRTDLNMRTSDTFTSVDPHNTTFTTEVIICAQIYETLYKIDKDMNEVPVLATSYSVSEDGLSAVFNIRDDVFFTNGDKLTATDVKFSLDRLLASPYIGEALPTFKSIDADDENSSITIHFTDPTPGLIDKVSSLFIVNKKFVEANQDENGLLGFNTCGTGPFMLKEYTLDESVTLVANPDYRLGEAALKTIKIYPINDENTIYTALKSGEIDLAISVNTPNWDDLKSDSAIDTAEISSAHVSYMVMNTQSELFKNKLLRQAIACAINRDDIVNMAMDGKGIPTYSSASSLMYDYVDVVSEFAYDPERAKALLAEAGYPDGVDIGEIQAIAGSYFADIAVIVQQQLADVGITSTVSSLEGNVVVQNAFTGGFNMLTMGQNNNLSMDHLDNYYNSKFIGNLNMAQYNNPEVDALLAEAKVCMDGEERIAIYEKVLDIVDEDCAYIYLFNKVNMYAWNSDLSFEPSVRDDSLYNLKWK